MGLSLLLARVVVRRSSNSVQGFVLMGSFEVPLSVLFTALFQTFSRLPLQAPVLSTSSKHSPRMTSLRLLELLEKHLGVACESPMARVVPLPNQKF